MHQPFDSTVNATASELSVGARSVSLGGTTQGPRQSRAGKGRMPLAGAVLCALLAIWSGSPWAQTTKSAGGGIYSCVDDRGRRLTSDRPIPECLAKEQRMLNADGSLKAMHPPSLTPEERAAQEARERSAAQARAARDEAVRRDRQLLLRFRTEPQHTRARESALEAVRVAQRGTQARLADLSRQRQALNSEAEFYKGQALPAKLRAQYDALDAAQAAQRDATSDQQSEIERISKHYDTELQRLRLLWNGMPPGAERPAASSASSTLPAGPSAQAKP